MAQLEVRTQEAACRGRRRAWRRPVREAGAVLRWYRVVLIAPGTRRPMCSCRLNYCLRDETAPRSWALSWLLLPEAQATATSLLAPAFPALPCVTGAGRSRIAPTLAVVDNIASYHRLDPKALAPTRRPLRPVVLWRPYTK